MWKNFGVPAEMMNHISAKIIRYFGYQERVAGTRNWNYYLQWASGLHISLVHLISHMLDEIIDVQQEAKWRSKITPTVAVAIGALGVRHAHGQGRPGHQFLDERRGPVPVGDPRGRLSSFISSSYWRSGDLSSRSNFERHVALLSVLAQHIHHTTERRASRAAEAQ